MLNITVLLDLKKVNHGIFNSKTWFLRHAIIRALNLIGSYL